MVTDAVQWNPSDKPTAFPDWFWAFFGMYPELFDEKSESLTVPTREGNATARPGDWIVYEGHGMFYVRKNPQPEGER